MYKKLMNVISESGIWNDQRRVSHAFLLSPSVYHITKAQEQELRKLGYGLSDCLLGLSHMAVIAFDTNLNYNGAWTLVRKVFSTGVPRMYHELQGLNVKDIPRLLKVDFMVDQSGNFKIAEIDGHNKHGLGYSTLGKRLREFVMPDAQTLPGVVSVLAKEVIRLGYKKLKFFYADQERFYVPEFEIAVSEFSKHGVICELVSEMDASKEFVKEGLFLDLPFLYHEVGLYETIINAYKKGDVSFILPPKPCLGAKGVLALLRNDGNDRHIESLLETFIPKHSLDLVRSYIPETFLVGKLAENIDSIRRRLDLKKYVLKESISSGMKGTIFSDDPSFSSVLAKVSNSNLNWILQEEVENQPQSFEWYTESNGVSKKHSADNWLMRVTTQYVNRQLADVIVTARQDKAVHGAKDSLQLGTIIV